MTDRAAIKRDLEVLRQINIEAKLLRARLGELKRRKGRLTMASIAQAHGVPVQLVQSISHGMAWNEAEKSPQSPLPPYNGLPWLK